MKTPRLPWVVPEFCEGCTSCVAACPKRLLSMRAVDEDTFIPWLDQPDECNGCGRCSETCAMGGIAMTTFTDEARARFLACHPARSDADGIAAGIRTLQSEVAELEARAAGPR